MEKEIRWVCTLKRKINAKYLKFTGGFGESKAQSGSMVHVWDIWNLKCHQLSPKIKCSSQFYNVESECSCVIKLSRSIKTSWSNFCSIFDVYI